MNDKKETLGPVEKTIISMVETNRDEIFETIYKGAKTSAEVDQLETTQNTSIVNLITCVMYLAKQIDKLTRSLK